MLNATEPAFADFDSMPTPLVPITPLSATVSRHGHLPNASRIPKPVMHLLRYVHNAILMFESRMLETKGQDGVNSSLRGNIVKKMAAISLAEEILPPAQLDNTNPIFIACRYAANIHLNSFRQAIPFTSDYNQNYVRHLRACLSQVTKTMWHTIGIELFIWLCFTGAVAAKEGKLWFLAQARPTGPLLTPDGSNNLKLGMFRFCRCIHNLEEMNI